MRGDLLRVHRHLPVDQPSTPTVLARRAVALGAGAAAAISTALVTFGWAYAAGGEDATSDNWVGVLVVVLLYGGLIASLAGFALALAARMGHERWAWLWLPLAVFPALVAFLVLGEAFWWE